jgi:hypothetical protein
MITDFKLTDDGQFVIGANGDLELVTGDLAIAQQIIFRLKTTKKDWTLSPDIGANLDQFIGQPNSRETRDLIEAAIFTELTKDNLVIDPKVVAIALGENEVFIMIDFNSVEEKGKQIQITSNLDLRIGLVSARLNE